MAGFVINTGFSAGAAHKAAPAEMLPGLLPLKRMTGDKMRAGYRKAIAAGKVERKPRGHVLELGRKFLAP